MFAAALKKYRNLLFFGAAGVLGYFVDLSVTLCLELLVGPYLARVPAFLCASTATWIFNRGVTFRHQKAQKGVVAEWIHYISLMAIGLIVNYCVYSMAISFMSRSVLSTSIAVALGSLAGMVINFSTSSKFLYKKSK